MSGEPTAHPHRPWRLILAFLLAPVVASFVGALILVINGFADRITHPSEDGFHSIAPAEILMLGSAIGATWGQLPILVLSLNAHTQLMKHTTRKAWMYSAAGASAGLIFGALFVGGILFGLQVNLTDIASLIPASLFAGAIGGLVFWLIRRPDRDATASAPPPAAAPAHRTHGQAGDI